MTNEIMDINAIREILAEEITKIREGKTTAANVHAITNAAGKILSSVKLEMEYAKIVGKTPSIPFIQIKEQEDKNTPKLSEAKDPNHKR